MQYLKVAILLGLSCALSALSARANGGGVSIYLAADAQTVELRKTADAFADILHRIDGKAHRVLDEAYVGTGVLLALTRDAKAGPLLTDAEGKRLESMSGEAYLLRGEGQDVCIIGNTPQAVQHGAFDLLSELGFRVLAPPRRWHIVPDNSTWRLAKTLRFEQPDFQTRSFFYTYNTSRVKSTAKLMSRDFALWCDANRMGGLTVPHAGHSFAPFIRRHLGEFEAHPEWLQMRDGKRIKYDFKKHGFAERREHGVCYSNPELAELFVKDKLEELRKTVLKNTHDHMVTMEPEDTSIACTCDACRKLGNGADQVLYPANQVAKALRKVDPNAQVGVLIYPSHALPPENTTIEPNIYAKLCLAFNRTDLTYAELVAGWRKSGLTAFAIYDYVGLMEWDWSLPQRGRATAEYFREAIPLFKQWGTTAYTAQSQSSWAPYGPAWYVASALLWNTKADGEARYTEYFDLAFGKASQTMNALFSLWDDNAIVSQGNMKTWLQTLDRARQLTKNETPAVKERVEDMMIYLHYVALFDQWKKACGTGKREVAYTALKPLLTFTYRVRDRQMVHDQALRNRLVNGGVDPIRPVKSEFYVYNRTNAVWKVDTPVSSEEINELFQSDLRHYSQENMRDRSYSLDLVPLGAPHKNIQPTGGLRRQPSSWYISVPEPMMLKIEMAHNPIAAFSIKTMDGTIIAEGKPENRYARSEIQCISAAIPKAGIYRLKIAGLGGVKSYCPLFPDGVKAVLEISQYNMAMSENFGPLYVYVPKGTEKLYFDCWSITIKAPSWKKARLFTNTKAAEDERHERPWNEELRCMELDVGNDDGHVWIIGHLSRGEYHFYNIPPYAAGDPGDLLVPKEALQ